MLELCNVSYTYRGKYQTTDVLKGISFRFDPARTYAVIGKSGSGKTTLLNLLAGLTLPTEGEVIACGQNTRRIDRDRYRRETVSVIYQNFRLFALLTALENVMYPMQLRGIRRSEARKRAMEQLEEMGLPREAFDRFPAMLSGGEQQRVAIARALCMDTRIILADEPTGNLDDQNSRVIIDILTSLAARGYCVVIITHDLGILDRVDVVLRMAGGLLKAEDIEESHREEKA